ncbi:unnamed protein product [Rangifer tarandus platyrhynchus]|uniref:Uncharacterized protein n=1 Tax=Rangifer tarandus platyrhynchus TaxID=3082113 RepID=A0AC59YFN9_RANTA
MLPRARSPVGDVGAPGARPEEGAASSSWNVGGPASGVDAGRSRGRSGKRPGSADHTVALGTAIQGLRGRFPPQSGFRAEVGSKRGPNAAGKQSGSRRGRRDSGLGLAHRGFPGGSAGKESTCKAGDLGSVPGLGRSPGEGKGCPLQDSGLKNPMDCPWGRKKSDTTERLSLHFQHLPENNRDGCSRTEEVP